VVKPWAVWWTSWALTLRRSSKLTRRLLCVRCSQMEEVGGPVTFVFELGSFER